MGHLNSSQILLPMSYWSSGIGAEDRWHLSIDTVRFSGWISLRLGELCMISTEVLCAATSELGKSSSYSVYVPSEPSFSPSRPVFFREMRFIREGGVEEGNELTSTRHDLLVFWFLRNKHISNMYIHMAIASTGFYTGF